MNTLPQDTEENNEDDSQDWSEDMKAISNMIKTAAEAEMLLEVIETFGDMRAAGDTVAEAVYSALYEWDC